MNPKVAFRNTLQIMNVSRPVFVPFVYGLAAKIGQVPLREMLSNATYYAHSLEVAYKLFKYDAIINNFDSSIEAEACGCELEWGGDYEAPVVTGWGSCELETAGLERSSRVPVLIEATKRLVTSLGKEIAVIGVVTGPCSLAKNLAGHAVPDRDREIEEFISLAGRLLTKLTSSLCELRIDAVFVREDLLGAGYWEELMLLNKPYAAVYATLFNLVRYYNSYPVLIVKDFRLEVIEDLYKILRPSGVILCGKRVSEADLVYLKDLSNSLKIAFGLPLPMGAQNELLNQFNVINDFVGSYRLPGFFYTTDGEIPHDMPLEIIHDLIAKIRNIQEV